MARTVLVTGGNRGIGLAIAQAFAKQGDRVAITHRGSGAPDGLFGVTCDITDPTAVDAAFTTIEAELGPVEVLVANAGITDDTLLMRMSEEQFSRVVDTNLTGVFLCTREAFRIMKAQTPRGGRIINNGSISAHAPRPHSVAYTATKHAITGLTKSTALDGRAHDIACGQIDIGNAATELTAKMPLGVLQPNGQLASEPTIDTEHVGRAVVYMATLPLDTNVQFMTLMATKMPWIGRG